jgi:hypothetical protein
MKRCHGQGFRVIRGSIRLFAVSVAAVFIATPLICSAEMTVMSDSELAQVTGSGYSKFTLVDGVALAEFDVRVLTYTEIDSMKLAYWDNGTGSDWDENWTTVKLGSEAQDLDLKGFFVRAEFENINDAANRALKSFKIGFKDVTGTLEADFNSFNGDLNSTAYHRSFLGNRTFQLTNSELSLSINIDGPHKGIWYTIDNATIVH